MEEYKKNCKYLKKQLEEYAKEDVIVAFSGGVDSSLLLKMVCEASQKAGIRIYAVTIETKLHPAEDIKIAKRVAEETGAIHRVLPIDELSDAGIEDNPLDRCYRCKKYLFSEIKNMAESLGVKNILEGTNEDDLHVYRPGIRAVRELGIKSPLADAKMTKVQIRRLAGEYGISVAKRPSGPCLATRFPYGARLSYEVMHNVEQGEKFLKELGFYNVRIRVHGNITRIEVDEKDIPMLISLKEQIIRFLRNLGFLYITVDLQGFRSGSMDENLKEEI